MKSRVYLCVTILCMSISAQTYAYSGELWLSQAKTRFGQPASMLAHGFLAGVVHSWNGRQDPRQPKLCFDAPPSAMQIRNLMEVVTAYIDDRNPDLGAPAQGIIRVAMMTRFPCRDAES
jgi:hypothetical protein